MEDRPSRPIKSGGRLERVLIGKQFAVTAEVVPPASPDPSSLIASARQLKGSADAFNVTDNPRARVHMASWAGAGLLVRDGLEPGMHLVRKEWLHEKLHILAGVVPLKSLKAARFMNEKVPGVVVPADVLRRIEKASDAKAEGLAIAIGVVEALKKIEGVRGVHLMAVNWDDVIPAIVRGAGLHPRPSMT